MESNNRPVPRSGQIPVAEHLRAGWQIREIAPDFEIEDVWALPATGPLSDFDRCLELMLRGESMGDRSPVSQFLWWFRDQLGRFGFGRITQGLDEPAQPIPTTLGEEPTTSTTVSDRLPADLQHTVARDFVPPTTPFRAVYRTEREYVAELSNATVHSLMHIGWADRGDGLYQAEMAVYTKPRGTLGRAYMAFIKPFRMAFIYPDLLRSIDRRWRAEKAATAG